ncbi:hypothetical protein GCM10020229_40070 [Kitasatospora albolonga]
MVVSDQPQMTSVGPVRAGRLRHSREPPSGPGAYGSAVVGVAGGAGPEGVVDQAAPEVLAALVRVLGDVVHGEDEDPAGGGLAGAVVLGLDELHAVDHLPGVDRYVGQGARAGGEGEAAGGGGLGDLTGPGR